MALLYLASRSPRRRKLLEQLGFEFQTIAVDVVEIWDGKENASDYVSRLALGKARAARGIAEKQWPILASDTEVVLDDKILGKPDNTEDAISMLMSLSGRSHEVYSAVVLLYQTEQIEIGINRVTFKEMTRAQCRDYCDSCEPFDKAGAYGIQDRAAAFICKLEGSYSSVMGLPLLETAKLLKSIQ